MRAIRLPDSIRNLDSGFWAAIGSSCMWGMLPLYWKLLIDVPPYLILSHRVFWSFVFLLPLVVLSGRTREVARAAKNVKTMLGLCGSSVFLACNWLTYIWAVNNGHILETSLGYYISPLLTICMGVAFFRDRPSRARWVAIAVAAAGVTGEVLINGTAPWISLALAVSFAVYALLRKLAPVESLPGLMLETLILSPFALGFILWVGTNPEAAAWGASNLESALLMGAGVITSVPLILYAYGARHLPFTTLGILQYISPSCSFMIGLFLFGEPITLGRAVSFTAIWIALALYTADSLRTRPPRARELTVKPEPSGK